MYTVVSQVVTIWFLSPHAASEVDEGERSTVRYRPEGLDHLVEQTNFSKKELQILYRGFKNVSECLILVLLNNHEQYNCTEFDHHRSVCMDLFYHMRTHVCVSICVYVCVIFDMIIFDFHRSAPLVV